MSSKKLFGVKNITSLIYGIVMLFPLFSILGRVIYVQANANAKDSYYGETINDSVKHTGYSGNDKYYTLVLKDLDVSTTTTIDVKSVKADNLTLEHAQEDITQFVIYIASNTPYFRISYLGYNPQYVYLPTVNALATISFYITAKDNNTYDSYFSYFTYNKYSYLDNAFEYSISKFTQDNNLGNVDMFGWFTDLFLDSSNSTNNLYIGFVNWYLNYALLVSSGYLMFLVLIWFINFVRRILDKSMYQDYGGF